MNALLVGAALALLIASVRMAAFFRGSAAGFAVVSFLRLNLDAATGDATARRLVEFARKPGAFPVTAAVGAHLANALIALSICLLARWLFGVRSIWGGVALVLLAAPVLLVATQLIPRQLSERAPLRLLKQGFRRFEIFHRLFLPVSGPLLAAARFVSRRLGHGAEEEAVGSLGMEVAPKRLTDVQSRLIHGLLHASSDGIAGAMTPAGRILGLPDSATVGQILDHAARFGLTAVPVRRSDPASEQRANPAWHGYVRVVDAAVMRKPARDLVIEMPRISLTASRIEALLTLCREDAACGAVYDGENFAGLVHRHGLTLQLLRPPVVAAKA